jgi:hypothetical protein
MNQPRQQAPSSTFFWLTSCAAFCIVVFGAIAHVTYRNKQIQTAREIEATEKRITAIRQDGIPSIEAEIDRHLARYDLREKLRQQGSKLIATPPEHIQVIRMQNPSLSQQTLRP